jgi:hypothetical protein
VLLGHDIWIGRPKGDVAPWRSTTRVRRELNAFSNGCGRPFDAPTDNVWLWELGEELACPACLQSREFVSRSRTVGLPR